MNRKTILIAAVLLLIAVGILLVPHFVRGQGQKDLTESAAGSSQTVSAEVTPEPVYVSDPIYGDQITEEELQEMKEETESQDGATISIGEEFVIELGETQGSAGF